VSTTVILGGGFGGFAAANALAAWLPPGHDIVVIDRSPRFHVGAGYCFLETGRSQAVKADGEFFALPHPLMRRRPPDTAQLREKVDWVASRLRAGA
jgi:2-polyprenyl-6-methoxyphenol hydroxylase-like FAD-dependent oxidoreductase